MESAKMHVHRVLVIGMRHVLDRTDLNDAGVVDQHVDAAEPLHRDLYRMFDMCGLAHVARDRDRAAAQLGCGPRQLVAASRRNARRAPCLLSCSPSTSQALETLR